MRLQYKEKNVNNNDKISIDEVTTTDVRKPNEETETKRNKIKEIIDVRIVKNPEDTDVTNDSITKDDIRKEAGIVIKPSYKRY